jgi:predicted O-methyltransferase YrrM
LLARGSGECEIDLSPKTIEASFIAKHVSTNSVLDRIVETGHTILPSGEEVEATGYIDPSCGALLQRAIRDVRPCVGLEVGLAFGISTLYILEALNEAGGKKLIGMDPAQRDDHWRGGGLHNIREAGYESLYEFHENTSQQVLPALVGEGQRIDFAFIDGWHTFDHTLIDFFYIDQMLNVGGIMVFDDVSYPAIRRVCDFIVTNRAYEVFDSVRVPIENTSNRRLKHTASRFLDPLVRTDKTPAPEARKKEFEIDDVYFLALRKRGDDSRRWDHFEQF